jgi:hypothetical protein
MVKTAGLYDVPIKNYLKNSRICIVAYTQWDYSRTVDARALKFDDEVPSRYLSVHRKFHRKVIMLNGIIQSFPKATFSLFEKYHFRKMLEPQTL